MESSESKTTKSLLCFGQFTIDLERHALYRLREPIHLTGKPFETLVFLVQNQGQTVKKETLLHAVWKDLFVTENTLERAISEIRRALGDDRERPAFIQTIPRQGYRFIATVINSIDGQYPRRRATDAQEAEPPPRISLISDARPGAESQRPASIQAPAPGWLERRRIRWRIVAVLACCALPLAVILYLYPRSPLSTPKVTRSFQITHSPWPKLAPILTDGPRLYFMELRDGRYTISQVPIAGGNPVPIEIPLKNAYLCDISPETAVLLVRDFNDFWKEEGSLWAVPILSGSPRRLGNLRAFDAAWSPDGLSICYTSGSALYLARSDGSESRRLTTAEGEPWWPRWSPDGRKLRFTVFSPKNNTNSIWEIEAEGTNLRPLLPDWKSPPAECCGNWTPNGENYLFQSTRQGVDAIWSINESDGRFFKTRRDPVQLTPGPVNFRGPVPSREGKRIFVKGTLLRSEVTRLETNSRRSLPFLEGISIETLDFSKDSDWIAYTTLPEGTLWRSKTDGSQRLQLSFSPMRAALPRWQPDGRRIVFMGQNPGKPWNIYMVSAEGAGPEQLLPEDRNQADPGCSRDGQLVLFGGVPALDSEPSRDVICLLNLKTRRVETLPGSEGLFSPRWSPDGRFIVALASSSQKLMLYDHGAQKWAEVANVRAGYPAWSQDGRSIYFLKTGQDERSIWRFQIGDQKLEQVVSLKDFRQPPTTFGGWIGLGPDDVPLALRDLTTQEIYALEWQAP
jgi:DNA-binding winged helix-turn-helix (wHTH) protein/Tol biopolymer transport system component